MRRRGVPNRNGGYTLLELLVYVVVLAVIVNLSSSLFLTGRRLHAIGNSALEQTETLRRAGRDFHESVLRAESVEDATAGVTVDGPHLVMRERGPEGAARFVVWHLDDGGALRRQGYERVGERLLLRSSRAYVLPITDLSFAIDDGPDYSATLIRMEIEIDNTGMRNTVPGRNVFVAAMRGG